MQPKDAGLPSLSPQPTLSIGSYLAPNWFWFYRAIAAYFHRSLALETSIAQRPYDPLDDPLLKRNELDLVFICGLPFSRQRHRTPDQMQAVVAPVMRSPRYGDRPVYFADIIVRANSAVTTLAALAGKTLCYNDAGSNSGWYLLRHYLIQKQYPHHFLGKCLQSGSHQRSMRWVAEGRADYAAIDSTVLERELQDFPALSEQIRILESIGPCPMPPLAAAQRLGSRLIGDLRDALLQPDAELQAAMHQAGVSRFAAVASDDYEAIAHLYTTVCQQEHTVETTPTS